MSADILVVFKKNFESVHDRAMDQIQSDFTKPDRIEPGRIISNRIESDPNRLNRIGSNRNESNQTLGD